MTLFELAAKITLDDKEFQSGMEKASKSSKEVANAVKSLQNPFDTLEKVINAVKNPVNTARSAFEKLKDVTETIRHPISALRTAYEEHSQTLERQRNMLQTLSSRYDSAQSKVEGLRKEYARSVEENGKTARATQELARELSTAEANASQAKETLNKYASAVSEAGEQSRLSGEKIEKAFNVMKAATIAVSGAVAIMGKQSIEAYANYEQLVGGVETLFGTGGKSIEEYAERAGKSVEEISDEYGNLMTTQNTVFHNAQQAYKTAGLSANEYMDTVTSFSASLIQSLGGDTARAADYADKAIIDMADNANKMGTSMESIQNAYQGFAKQNYTMLDNLKLGYGGTKEEMERLLEDAEKIKAANGEMVEYSIGNFADMVEAIHIVQEEMGITGTTALEADTTIQGSLNSLKAAWSNLLVGIAADNANLDLLLQQFFESVGTAAENLIPRIGTFLVNMGKLMLENGPQILEKGMYLLTSFLTGMTNKLPDILAFVVEMVKNMAITLLKNAPQLIGAGLGLIGQLIGSLAQAVINIGTSFVTGIWKGIQSAAGWFMEQVKGFFTSIVDGVKGALGIHSPSTVFASIGKNMVAGLGEGWDKNIGAVRKDIMSDMDFGAAVLSATAEYGAGGYSSGRASVNVVQNIYSEAKTAADLMEEALFQQKKAVMLNV